MCSQPQSFRFLLILLWQTRFMFQPWDNLFVLNGRLLIFSLLKDMKRNKSVSSLLITRLENAVHHRTPYLKILCSLLFDDTALFQLLYRVHLPWLLGLKKTDSYSALVRGVAEYNWHYCPAVAAKVCLGRSTKVCLLYLFKSNQLDLVLQRGSTRNVILNISCIPKAISTSQRQLLLVGATVVQMLHYLLQVNLTVA